MANYFLAVYNLPMTMYRKKIGVNGEQLAEKFLRKQGYKILQSNYKNYLGEIDIVAQDKENLVFIEVKTRTNDLFGSPAEAVNYAKQQKIKKVAMAYLHEHQLDNCSCRFDVVCIEIKQQSPEIELLQNVF